jgi:hypothetical protein
MLEHVEGDNEVERGGWKNLRPGNARPIASDDFTPAHHPTALGTDFEAAPRGAAELAEEAAVAAAEIEERGISGRKFANDCG